MRKKYMEAWSEGYKAALAACLPNEIGWLHRNGYDVLALCCCLKSLFENGKAVSSRCGKWKVVRTAGNVFECRYLGGKR